MDIKEIVEMSGLSQTDFAKKHSIPLRTLQHWVAGDRECPEYVLIALKKIEEFDN